MGAENRSASARPPTGKVYTFVNLCRAQNQSVQPDVRPVLLDEPREGDGHVATILSIGEYAGLRRESDVVDMI